TEAAGLSLVVWDLKTGKRVRAHRLPVSEAEPEKPFPLDLAGGRYFVCEYREKLLAVDLKTGEEWRHDMGCRAGTRYLRMSPTGEVLARFNGYFVTHLIETRTGKVAHQVGDHVPGRPHSVYGKADGAEFTPDGRCFVYHYREAGGRALRVWD